MKTIFVFITKIDKNTTKILNGFSLGSDYLQVAFFCC